MTREEAKELLLNISAYDIDMQRGMAKQEAIEMAIQALEQEPCEDAISRQAAIDAIENEQKKIMRSDWAIDQAKFSAMSEIRELIADLPSVSTEKVATLTELETLDKIASGKFGEQQTCIAFSFDGELKHCCVMNCKFCYGYYERNACGRKERTGRLISPNEYHPIRDREEAPAWMPLPQPYKGESEDKE